MQRPITANKQPDHPRWCLSRVEKEVETAFEKERKQRRTVLFPIRLDDAVV